MEPDAWSSLVIGNLSLPSSLPIVNAHSCCHEPGHCGLKKKDGLLPIEPGPGCNARFILNTDGEINAAIGQTKRQRHEVRQTRDMLGLNHPSLVRARTEWIESASSVLTDTGDLSEAQRFVSDKPHRFILRRLFAR